MKEIKYKILFAFAIPYLTLCAGLWHIGYWSTFDINILQHLDTADIIKGFIYPFISSVTLYLIGQIVSSFFRKKIKHGGAEETVQPKRLKITRYILITLFSMYIIVAFIFYGNDKWIWILSIVATFVGVILNNNNFLDNIIPNSDFRINFVYTIVLIPFLCFAVAKKKSLDVFEINNNQTTIVSIITQNISSGNIKYKLLGFASEFVFVMTTDNKSILMFPKSDIKQIVIDKNVR